MSDPLSEPEWQVFSISGPTNYSNNSNQVPETAVERLAATGFPVPSSESTVLPGFRRFDPASLWSWFVEPMQLHQGNALAMWQLVTWKKQCRPDVDLGTTCDRCAIFGLNCARSRAAYDAAAAARSRRRRGASHFDAMATYAEELGFIEPGAVDYLGIPRTDLRTPLEMRGVCCDNCLAASDKWSTRCSLYTHNLPTVESKIQVLSEELASVGIVADTAGDGPLARHYPRCLTCLVEDMHLMNGADKDRRKGPNTCCAVRNDAKCYRCREMGRDCVWAREFVDILDDSTFPSDPTVVEESITGADLRAGSRSADSNFVALAATQILPENISPALLEQPRPGVPDDSQSHDKGKGHAGQMAIDTEAASSSVNTAPSTATMRAEDDNPDQIHLPGSTPSIMVIDTDAAQASGCTDSAPTTATMMADDYDADEDEQQDAHDAAGPSTMSSDHLHPSSALTPAFTQTPTLIEGLSLSSTPFSLMPQPLKSRCVGCRGKVLAAGSRNRRSARACETDEANGRGCRQCLNYGIICVYDGYVMPRSRERRTNLGFAPCESCIQAAADEVAATGHATRGSGPAAGIERSVALCDRKQDCDRCAQLGLECRRAIGQSGRVQGLMSRGIPGDDLPGFYYTLGKEPGTVGVQSAVYGPGRRRVNWVMPDDYHYLYLRQLGVPTPSNPDEPIALPGREGPEPEWLQTLRQQRGWAGGAGGSGNAASFFDGDMMDATVAGGESQDDVFMGGLGYDTETPWPFGEGEFEDGSVGMQSIGEGSFYGNAEYGYPENFADEPGPWW